MGKHIVKNLGVLLAVLMVAGLVFVSLLGENDRAATTVRLYFNNIAEQRYDANARLCTDSYNRQFDNVNDPVTHQFSLETAILNHFGLIDTNGYAVVTTRDGFWIPYLSNDTLHISVEFQNRRPGTILANILADRQEKPLKNLVTVTRRDGKWLIADIDTRTSPIAKDYLVTKKSMQNSKYIQQTADSLIIKENTIPFAKIDPVQKRIINFNFTKALALLNSQK